MIVLSCRLLSSGSFVLTGLGFQVVVRLVGSVGRFGWSVRLVGSVGRFDSSYV
jgi:hypothetical protein